MAAFDQAERAERTNRVREMPAGMIDADFLADFFGCYLSAAAVDDDIQDADRLAVGRFRAA